jgi:hypothetical protein
MSSAEKGVWSFSEFLQEQAEKRETPPTSAVPERLPPNKSLLFDESHPTSESLSPDAPKGYRAESHLSAERLSGDERLSNNLWASIAEVKVIRGCRTPSPTSYFNSLMCRNAWFTNRCFGCRGDSVMRCVRLVCL